MDKGKSFSWGWAAGALVAVQLVVLGGLWQLRQKESRPAGGWDLDPQAVQREGDRERESREALQNLPLPSGASRLSLDGARQSSPSAGDLLAQARQLQSQGQLDLAEKLLSRAREMEPRNQAVQVAAALLAESREDTGAALARWRELIREAPPTGSVRKLALARAHIVEERLRLEQVARLREETLARQPRKMALSGVREEALSGEGKKVGWQVRVVEGGGNVDPAKISVRVSFFERAPEGLLRPAESTLPHWAPSPPVQQGDADRVVYAESRIRPGSRYAGYLWQLYYAGELQDERVSPASLRGVLREKPRS